MSTNIFATQAGRPVGLIGKVMGRIMAWHNQPDNEWTVSLLEIQPTDHVLEIGFGPGQAIRYASRRVPDGLVCGIDHSETMVQEASKYNAAAVAAGRVALKQGDVAALPYDNEAFHKAFSINCIYFWPQPLDGLREIHRVLKPGGVIALTVRNRQRNAYKPFTAEKLTVMLAQAGFRQTHYVNGPYPAHPILSAVGIK